ncbi:MAG: ABC transporter [Oscillatoriales cyanobacterium RM2_1_1]|nr:ABC transporter [Oscillatoriales cyanobacterium SM2_3_0]NJO44160.1 ABC transporter [Oscillatoriales cyanobacterium RM2_1_1]
MKKSNFTRWEFLKYIFWLGPALIITGLTTGFVSGIWFPEALSLLISGLVITGLWYLFQAYFRSGGPAKTPYWSRRSTQAGTNALAATLSMLAILGLLNFLAVRNTVQVDLTENQQFTLAPQTQSLIKTLEQPVKIWVFERAQNPQTQALLNQYRDLAPGLVSYEFVDPQTQPGVAQDFGVKDFGEIYLESGSKRQPIRKEGIEPLTEVQLTNGIDQLLSDRTPKVYFLQGHGERPIQEGQGGILEAVDTLKERNFITEELTLAQVTTIPPDADVIVVASPQRQLFTGEVAALENFLNQGKGVMLLIDPKTNSGLAPLLDNWGVKLDDQLAIDGTGSGNLVGLGPTVPIVREYGDHPITRDFGNGISFYPYARPVETRPVEGTTESPLIWTDPESWAESDLSGENVKFDQGRDRQGPLSLGVALSRMVQSPAVGQVDDKNLANDSTDDLTTNSIDNSTAPTPDAKPGEAPETESTSPASPPQSQNSKNQTTEARLVVIGNSQFATNGWFGQQLNGDVFLNSVNWLSKPDRENLSIRPKPITNRRIAMTPVLGRTLSWVALVILPLFGFFMAGLLWWRRR